MTDPSHLDLTPVDGFDVYPRSRVSQENITYAMVQECASLEKYLAVYGPGEGFTEKVRVIEGGVYFRLNARNAQALRSRLPWMQPQPGGLRPSFGFGDRLGLASPGHALAAWEANLYPIFAQQSVRENARTGRSPQQVVDEAMWGIFQLGWGKPWGADADHLKSLTDVGAFVAAGYTFYTVDPGEYVGSPGENATSQELKTAAAGLPWADLDSSPEATFRQYLNQKFLLEVGAIELDETALLRAMVKYGGAIAHTRRMYQTLLARIGNDRFDFEVSVDETETPTLPAEHYYIASELRRLGVRWNSLAPRFPGRFEKGVDFIGDMVVLEADLAQHAAILRHFGGYKLSLHSGSDKFSVYAGLARHTGSLVHVKTAGTSYLEALRVAAVVEPGFFREVLDFSRGRYPVDRASYHVSAQVERVPPAGSLKDSDLPALLDDFHTRQVLHVTYGSVLDRFGKHLKTLLVNAEAAYTAGLHQHFQRHLAPFTS
jgi:hypothetical protein